MSRTALDRLLRAYPWSMREQVNGYVDAVDGTLREIFEDGGVRYSEELAGELLFVVGVRKLWSMIDGQYSVLRHSLDLMSDQGAPAVRFGGTVYSRTSQNFQEVRNLRDDLRSTLTQLEIFDLMYLDVVAVLQTLAEQGRSNGR